MQEKVMSLGEKADLLYMLRMERYGLQKNVDSIKEQEESLSKELIAELSKLDSKGIAGSVAMVSVKHKNTAVVSDWEHVYKFILDTSNFQLLQRRISQSSFDELLNDGVEISGIINAKVPTLSITKVRS